MLIASLAFQHQAFSSVSSDICNFRRSRSGTPLVSNARRSSPAARSARAIPLFPRPPPPPSPPPRALPFRAARPRGRGSLRWCVPPAAAWGGRPAPAAVLARKVRRELGVEPPEPTAAELLERAAGLLRRALEIENTPERTRKKLQMALETLEQA